MLVEKCRAACSFYIYNTTPISYRVYPARTQYVNLFTNIVFVFQLYSKNVKIVLVYSYFISILKKCIQKRVTKKVESTARKNEVASIKYSS